MIDYRQLVFWMAAALVAVAGVLTLRSVLMPFVLGMVIAYALNPTADRLEALGLGRLAASAIVVAMLLVVAVLAIVFLAPLLISQLQQIGTSLPGELERLKMLIDGWAKQHLGARYPEFQAGFERAAAQMSNNWADVAGSIARTAWSRGLAVVNFLSLVLITPLVVFYMLVDWRTMLAKVDGWLPRDHQAVIRRLAREIDQAIAAFIRGQGFVCLALGLIYGVGLAMIGIRYGLLIGIVTGLLAFVPFAGWALGLLIASALAVVQSWPDTLPLLKVVAVFAAGMAIDSAVLSPKIVGSKIGLHPVWLIFALFVFSYLFGFTGMLVAVPLAAAFGVLVRYALEVYLSSSIYRGSGTAPAATEQRPPPRPEHLPK